MKITTTKPSLLSRFGSFAVIWVLVFVAFVIYKATKQLERQQDSPVIESPKGGSGSNAK